MRKAYLLSIIYSHQRALAKWLFICFSIIGINAQAQDPIYSQPFATPMYTNPAFTGTGQYSNGGRASLNYRNQWPSLPSTFVTTTFAYDQPLDFLGGGLGVMAMRDVADEGTFTSNSLSALYSYLLPVTRKIHLRFGLGAGFIQRRLDFSKIRCECQFTGRGFIKPTSEPILHEQINSFNLSSGILAYSDIWHFGISVDHINRPNESFYGDPSALLSRRITLQAGSEFQLEKWEKPNSSFSVNAVYIEQGESSQLNLGTYLNVSWFVSSVWFKQNFNDSKIDTYGYMALVGWRNDWLRAGYSYDLTKMHKRGAVGSHEISIVWDWRGKKIKERKDILNYPDF
jgi:type IX secretion system PorP/SprF family membrane protein